MALIEIGPVSGVASLASHVLTSAVVSRSSSVFDSPIYTVRYASEDDVVKSLREVADELRSTYDSGYRANGSAWKGFRKVEIRVKRPGYVVMSKPGYYAR